MEREEMAEEQGWVARMVHLFRADSLSVQFEVSDVNIGVILADMAGLVTSNGSETFRCRWGTDAIHFPCSHNIINKIMQTV